MLPVRCNAVRPTIVGLEVGEIIPAPKVVDSLVVRCFRNGGDEWRTDRQVAREPGPTLGQKRQTEMQVTSQLNPRPQ